MLDLLTAFTRLLASSLDFLVYAVTTGSRLGQTLAVGLVAIGVAVTLWTLFYRRPRRQSRLRLRTPRTVRPPRPRPPAGPPPG